MKNNFLSFFKKSYFNYFLFAFIISLILFRGRLGSDDLEVFNYIYDFHQFNGSFLNFLIIYRLIKNYFMMMLKNTLFIQLYIDLLGYYKPELFILLLTNFYLYLGFKNFFIIQYASGYALTFSSVISIFLFNKILQKKN